MGANDQHPQLWISALLLSAGGVAAVVWAALTQHPTAIGSAIVLGVSGLALFTLARTRRHQNRKD